MEITTMKLFPTGHATHPQWRMAAALVLAQLRAQMALPDYAAAPTLGLLYITDHYGNDAQALLDYLSGELPEVTDWSGTVGVGVSANNAEYFDEPALSVMLLDVPADQYRVFSGVAPLPTHAPHPGSGFVAHTALVHADGRTPELAELLTEMAARTDTGYLFGGLSASRTSSVQFAVGGDGSMAGQGGASGVFDGGLSGVAFGAGVALVSRVTQGCQPVGALRTITAAQDNVVLALDGEPALDVLLDTLQVSLDGGDPQPALRKVRATLAGLVSAGEQPQGQRRTGHFGTDTRVRHIVGLDGSRRGVALADHVEPGMHLAFCQRNVAAAGAARILAGPAPSCRSCATRWVTCRWPGSLPVGKLRTTTCMVTPGCSPFSLTTTRTPAERLSRVARRERQGGPWRRRRPMEGARSARAVVVCFGLFFGRQARGQDLVDGLAIHIHHFQLPVLPLHGVGHFGQAAGQQHDHAAQRVVAAAFLLGHGIQVQAVFQLGHGDVAVQQPAAVLALQRPRGLGVARLKLAGDGLDEVLQRDDALHLPVFVDDKRHVHVRQAEVVEQLHARDGFGHIQRCLQRLVAQAAARLVAQRG